MTLAIPTIHLNGTSKDALLQQVTDAGTAIRKAMEALQQAAPHGRDYYPQGESAIRTALDQHAARMYLLNSIYEQIEEIAIAISDGGNTAGPSPGNTERVFTAKFQAGRYSAEDGVEVGPYRVWNHVGACIADTPLDLGAAVADIIAATLNAAPAMSGAIARLRRREQEPHPVGRTIDK